MIGYSKKHIFGDDYRQKPPKFGAIIITYMFLNHKEFKKIATSKQTKVTKMKHVITILSFFHFVVPWGENFYFIH